MSSLSLKTATLGALLLAAACENPSAPTPIDLAALTAGPVKLQTVLQAPVTRGLDALSGYLFRLSPAVTPRARLAPGGASGPSALASLLGRVVVASPALASTVDTLRGKTLEYRCDLGTYAVSARTGAPPAAVRFALYATDSNGIIPCPAVEIGHADFADTVASGQAGLHVIATDMVGTAYVDYIAGGSAPPGGPVAVTASGTVSDGSTPLGLSLTINVTSGGSDFTGAFDLSLGGTASPVAVAFHDDVTLQNGAGRENVDFTLRTGSQTARLAGPNMINGSGSSLNLSLSVNGAPFATVTGSFVQPSFSGPSGQALPADRLAAAQAVFHAPIEVSADVGSVLSPAEMVLQL